MKNIIGLLLSLPLLVACSHDRSFSFGPPTDFPGDRYGWTALHAGEGDYSLPPAVMALSDSAYEEALNVARNHPNMYQPDEPYSNDDSIPLNVEASAVQPASFGSFQLPGGFYLFTREEWPSSPYSSAIIANEMGQFVEGVILFRTDILIVGETRDGRHLYCDMMSVYFRPLERRPAGDTRQYLDQWLNAHDQSYQCHDHWRR